MQGLCDCHPIGAVCSQRPESRGCTCCLFSLAKQNISRWYAFATLLITAAPKAHVTHSPGSYGG